MARSAVNHGQQPAARQRLTRCAAAPPAAFLMEFAKSEIACLFGITAHVKDPQVFKSSPEPSTAARLSPV